MEEMLSQFTSVGAIGVIAYYLFKNTMDEKKEDRELFRKSVETFTDTSKTYAESIASLTVRVENVEEGIERIENNLEKVLNKVYSECPHLFATEPKIE